MTVLTDKKSNFSFLNKKHLENNWKEIFNYQFDNETLAVIDSKNNKDFYIRALNELQDTKVETDNEKIIIKFEDDYYSNLLVESGVLEKEDIKDNKHVYPIEERELVTYKINKAMDLLYMLNPNLGELVFKHLGTVVFAKKAGLGGGSISNLLGLLWLNPPKKWSVVDYAEALYHEFIHNSLFIDDMVNGIFPEPERCLEPEALTISTILKIKRPIDRSFHAANVAIGIMHFYYLLGDNEKMYQYKNDLNLTLTELNARKEYFGECGLQILEQMNNFNELYDFESITYYLNGNQ